ncbi:MAG TPA: lipoate--protein ligase family protein [Enteractinococcus helveticum]|uniref:lipoate--protein ligase n=1 Tax=Enteractinococcus helveticum TaxID=1837282 RepID=A0A921K7J1_9MICC|nr:lipoate protein ligase C-terminal domain-containing protein [Enteractinococcus helveticum]HJF14588.1 lipoate--protein ligase family protein [Enteractinococcus helveticum]
MTAQNTVDGKQLHGEFKVPGGKLVIADLDVTGGKITRANINGDFFLEPDEALNDINQALIGLSFDSSHSTIAKAIDHAVDDSVVMFGFDAHAVATAVRRATGFATRWEDHEWEILLPMEIPIYTQVALDQILTEDVGAGRTNPAMRLWRWPLSDPSVVIGSFQSYRNEVDAEAVEKYGIKVARRISGGGAMFMEADNAVTYSLYTPTSLVDGMSFSDSYPFLDAWVMEALQRMNVQAFYEPLNDISTPEGKIGGAAQKRLASGTMLHHVTMSYDIDAQKMTEVLRIGREKVSDKGITSAQSRVDPLRRHTGLSREDIWDIMIDTFQKRYDAATREVTADELARAEALAEQKFKTREWIHRVP